MKCKLVYLLLLLAFPAMSQSNRPYFQQEVRYNINVTLDDKQHTLSAYETLEYINNSPDTLRELWFHLWPNAYRNATTQLAKQKLENGSTEFLNAKENDFGSIDSLSFTSKGKVLTWDYSNVDKDICRIQLPNALVPGASIEISTPFFVKIPNANLSRLGHNDQAYAITQWYPKPAVYDAKGWHAMPYLDQGEFYSEYGSYEVSITLPSNYVLGASGELFHGESETAWLNEKANAEINTSNKDMTFPASESSTKTLTYKQDRIHDFAFFADKRYHVRKEIFTLPGSGKPITTWAFFTNNEATLWLKSAGYIKEALLDYSEWVGDYPFSSFTAIDGTIAAGGGMEYPMITIIGESDDSMNLESTIVHEVGHNWFYGILGSNERTHPWMDEGINSYYQIRSFIKAHPSQPRCNYNELATMGKVAEFLDFDKMDAEHTAHFLYKFAANTNSDQPISLEAEKFSYYNYGLMLYVKPVVAFNYLQSYLGTQLFDSCMQAYFNNWKFRHPSPDDMKTVFENTSGKNLTWFFKEVLSTNDKQELKLKSCSGTDASLNVKIKSKNNLLWPFPVTVLKDDSTIITQWIEPQKAEASYTLPCDGCTEIRIDNEEKTFDIYRLNNNSDVKGILKKSDPLAFKFLAGASPSSKQLVFFSPVVAWNNYNKFMAGVLLHNKFLPQHRFEYALVPMYGFHDKELAGIAGLDYHFLPVSHLFRDITLSLNARRFAFDNRNYKDISLQQVAGEFHYLRIRPAVRFDFKQDNMRKKQTQYIELSTVLLLTDVVNYTRLPNNEAYGTLTSEQANFYRIQYGFDDKRLLDPWSVLAKFEGADGLVKTDLTLKYRFSYKNVKRGVDFRLFTGIVWQNSLDGFYNYTLSDRSSPTGTTDYAYDEYYFGRSEAEGFLSKQMAFRDGAFKSRNPLGSFKERIISLNIEADFPGKIPFRFFMGLATCNDFKKTVEKVYDINQSYSAEGGICLSILREAVVIYLPLLRSAEIKKYEEANDLGLGDQIRFVFDLNKLNPLGLRKLTIQ